MNKVNPTIQGADARLESGEPLATAETPLPNNSRALTYLDGGYALHYQRGSAILDVHAPDGHICVRLTLAPEGPRIEVLGASLALHAEREIHLSCQRFAVDASEGITLRSGADLEVQAEGAMVSEGFSQRIVARHGDLIAIANDDIALDGERIRLNSPRPSVPR